MTVALKTRPKHVEAYKKRNLMGKCGKCENPNDSTHNSLFCVKHYELAVQAAKYDRDRAQRLRLDGLKQFAVDPNDLYCAHCQEDNINLLQLDHVHGNGMAHRRAMTFDGGAAIFRWLNKLRKEKKTPTEQFQVLCVVCNWHKRMVGCLPPLEDVITVKVALKYGLLRIENGKIVLRDIGSFSHATGL